MQVRDGNYEVDLDLLCSISSDLGAFDKDSKSYRKSDDCIGCLKDIQRMLRHDESDLRPVFFKLASFGTARQDLVPLITAYPGDADVVMNALKVLTFLTMPLDPTSIHPALQLEHMRGIKALFIKPEPVAVIVALVAEPLSRHPKMNAQDTSTVQLVLTFFRNLLLIPDADQPTPLAPGSSKSAPGSQPLIKAPSSSSSALTPPLQGPLLSTLFDENVMELILLVTQHASARPFRNEIPLLLSLLGAVFRGVGAQDLAGAQEPPLPLATATPVNPHPHPGGMGGATAPPRAPGTATAATVSRMDPASLALLQESLDARRSQRAMFLSSGPRVHSRGKGSFIRTAPDPPPSFKGDGTTQGGGGGGGGGKSIYLGHRFDKSDLPPAPAPPTASLKDVDQDALRSRMKPSVLYLLQQWSEELLKGGYNQLMEAARKEVEPGLGISKLEAVDFRNFLSLARLFSGYVRRREEINNNDKGKGNPSSDHAHPPAAAPAPAPAPSVGEGEGEGGEVVKSPYASLGATMGWSTFHLVHTLWLGQIDVPVRSDTKDWEMMHLSTSLLKEMLLLLDLAQKTGNKDDREAADKLQRRLLHDDMKESGLLPVLSRLMRAFNPKIQPRSHAADMMQAVHVILGIYDRLSSVEGSKGFMVKQRKAAGGGGGGRRKKKAMGPDEVVVVEGEEAGKKEGEGEEGLDAEGEEEQKQLTEGEEGSPKEVEEGEGGDESQLLQLQQIEAERAAAIARARAQAPLEEIFGEEDDDEEDEEDEEGRGYSGRGEGGRRSREVALDLYKRLKQEIATPAIVQFFVQQGLAHYATNSSATNASILAFLVRLSAPSASSLSAAGGGGGLGLEVMLYQPSILRIMHKMISDRSIRTPARLPTYQGLLKLATKVVRGLCAKIMTPAPPPSLLESLSADKDKGKDKDKGESAKGLVEEADADAGRKKPYTQDHVLDQHKVFCGEFLCDLMLWKTCHHIEIEIDSRYRMDRQIDEVVRDGGGGGGGGGGRRSMLQRRGPDDDSDGGGGGGGGGGDDDDEDWHGGKADNMPQDRPPAPRPPAAANGKAAAAPVDDYERLKKMQLKKVSAATKGNSSLGHGLGPELRAKLIALFERSNCSRANLDLVMDGMGANVTEKEVSSELRALGFKWGELTPDQTSRFKILYTAHQLNPDCTSLVAAGMTGGWTSKQVARLLVKHGLREAGGGGRGRRKGGDDYDDEDDQDGGGGGGVYDEDQGGLVVEVDVESSLDPPVDPDTDSLLMASLSDDDVKEVWSRLGPSFEPSMGLDPQRALGTIQEALRAACEELAVNNDLDAVPSTLSLYKRLELLGLKPSVPRPPRQRAPCHKQGQGQKDKAKRQPSGPDPPPSLLKQLYETYRNDPDSLNLITAQVNIEMGRAGGGGAVFSSKKVLKLLQKHGLIKGVRDRATGKKEKQSQERELLSALYLKHSSPSRPFSSLLQLIADDMSGVVTTKQVARMLKKHGLVDDRGKPGGPSKRRVGGGRAGERGGLSDEDEDMAGPGNGRVPEPEPESIERLLTEIDKAHALSKGKWMNARSASHWILNKLKAAEDLWSRLGTQGGVDYALNLASDIDEEFFMTDNAQELLEAVGFRNDRGDFYKIPGNAGQAWRQRVRSFLQQALGRLRPVNEATTHQAAARPPPPPPSGAGVKDGGRATEIEEDEESQDWLLKAAPSPSAVAEEEEEEDEPDEGSSDDEGEVGSDSSSDDDDTGEEEEEEKVEQAMPVYDSDEDGDQEEVVEKRRAALELLAKKRDQASAFNRTAISVFESEQEDNLYEGKRRRLMAAAMGGKENEIPTDVNAMDEEEIELDDFQCIF